MTILEYLAPFSKDGNLVDKTRVVWECDLCGEKRNSRFGFLRSKENVNAGKLCAACTTLGPPRTLEEVQKEYPMVIRATTFGKRGGIDQYSNLEAVCPLCETVYSTSYAVLRRSMSANEVRCAMCARRGHKSKEDVQTFRAKKKLPAWLRLRTDTKYGKDDRLTSYSKVDMQCPSCKRWRKSAYRNCIKKASLCKSCASKREWQRPEYRDHMITAWLANGGSSMLHKDVKKAMLQAHILGFESEKLIGKYLVDEVDSKRKLAIEIFGDYWHGNPAIYGTGDVVDYPRRTIPVEELWEKDKKRISYLVNKGYSTYIIWERDFRRQPQNTIRELADWMEQVNSGVVYTPNLTQMAMPLMDIAGGYKYGCNCRL